MALSREAAEKAYELDPQLADSQIRMGQQWTWSGEKAKAQKAFETALALEPNNSTALAVMAGVYADRGEFEKAIALYEKAETVDPMGSLWPQSLVSLYVIVGRLEDAENAAHRAFEMRGDLPHYLSDISYIYTIQGRYGDVLLLLEDRPEDWDKEGYRLASLYLHMAVAYHAFGRLDKADAMAKKLDALDDPYETLWIATLHAMQGDLDKAFVWLEKGSKNSGAAHLYTSKSFLEYRTNNGFSP